MIISTYCRLLLRSTPKAEEIQHGITSSVTSSFPFLLSQLEPPSTFRLLNPMVAENQSSRLLIASLFIAVAIVGKFITGIHSFRSKATTVSNRSGDDSTWRSGPDLCSIGTCHRGLRRTNLRSGSIMVMATTFVAPPWLKILLKRIGQKIAREFASTPE